MQNATQSYYDALSRDYATTIRQLVPRYDEMIDHVVSGLGDLATGTLFDIGTGTGEVSERVLLAAPKLRIVAIDGAVEMSRMAAERLAGFGDRARVIHADVTEFVPEQRFDAVVTSIVLHNLPPRVKRRTLRSILGWLVAGGRFIWADFVRAADALEMRRIQRNRVDYARTSGCPERLIEANFSKEADEDWPWTVAETLLAVRRTGFREVDCIWRHGAFAVFRMRRAGSRADPVDRSMNVPSNREGDDG